MRRIQIYQRTWDGGVMIDKRDYRLLRAVARAVELGDKLKMYEALERLNAKPKGKRT